MIDPGLCRTCRHARRVHAKPGRVYWLCAAHRFDPAMPKYPALPVRRCRHHSRRRDGDQPPAGPGVQE